MKNILCTSIALAICGCAAWLLHDDSQVASGQQSGPSQIHRWLGIGSPGADAKSSREKKRDALPMAVEVVSVRSQAVEDRIELVGSVEPIASVQIRSRASGYIKTIPQDIGMPVGVDALVVELDDASQQQVVGSFKAILDVAKAQQVSQLAKYNLALKQLERQAELIRSGVSTKQQEEQSAAELKVAKAQLALEEARVEQAQSDHDHSVLGLKELKIVAPLAGIVAERFVEVGDLADPNLPLLRIVDLSIVRTLVHVVEIDHPRIRRGQLATLRVDAYPDRQFHGRVVRKAPILNTGTRTGAVHIEIPNPDGVLVPGMHGRVEIVFSSKARADVVPVSAVIQHQRQPAVFVVSGDPPKSQLRPVKTGIRTHDVVEVLAGLQPDEQVVTLGNRLIKHGQAVTPVPGAWPLMTKPHGERVVQSNETTGD